ncbi:hypothetical protein SCHPADRAFT_1002833 [Schizopora paradoxa]|uniref:Uncharacterized protein n=1 Tax=Schizopora paradoxa TaxID=27342 RepID=A0A0H2R1G1_9AGAM|nr:hypothetical protein SCHPADRAFT_1002833 [Schizopora paradoxa]
MDAALQLELTLASKIAVIVNMVRAMEPALVMVPIGDGEPTILHKLAALNDMDLIVVVNEAFAIALEKNRLDVELEDLIEAYDRWVAGDA